MILDVRNESHYKLMNDVFDVPERTVKFCYVKYFGVDQDSIKKAIEQVISTLAHESITLAPKEIERLTKVLIAASKVDVHLFADAFTIVSKGKIAQIGTSREAKDRYSVDILVESLCNSNYYLNHRGEYADLSQT